MIAYHLDRSNTLKPGDEINLQIFNDIEPSYLNDILDVRYPLGLSRHGDQYYATQSRSEYPSSYLIESFFEYERQLHFPGCISRFQSFFAMKTIDEIPPWISILKPNPGYSIWEVEFSHDNCSRHDSSWLKLDSNNPSALQLAYCAKQYWSGIPSKDPVWEFLIKPPIQILKKIYL